MDEDIYESEDKSEDEVIQYYNPIDYNILRYKNVEKTEIEVDNNRKEKFLPIVQKKLHFWERIKLFFHSLKHGTCFEPFIDYKSLRFVYRIVIAICAAQGVTEDEVDIEKEQLEKKQPVNIKSTSFSYVPPDFEYKPKKFFKPKIKNTKSKLKIYKVDDSLNPTIDSQKPVEQKVKIEQSNQKEVLEKDKNEYYI